MESIPELEANSKETDAQLAVEIYDKLGDIDKIIENPNEENINEAYNILLDPDLEAKINAVSDIREKATIENKFRILVQATMKGMRQLTRDKILKVSSMARTEGPEGMGTAI